MYTDSLIFSFEQIKALIEGSNQFKEDFVFSVLDPSYEFIQKILEKY